MAIAQQFFSLLFGATLGNRHLIGFLPVGEDSLTGL
jgi:hypothetical protein